VKTKRGAPTPPIELAEGVKPRFVDGRVDVPDSLLSKLQGACDDVSVEPGVLDESGRDWWPITMTWALDGQIPARPAAVVRPREVEEVAAVLALCDEALVPVTAMAGRSGVCGGSLPVHGGIGLDLCALTGIVEVDDQSLTVTARAGTFGDVFEDDLRAGHGITVGHWPQSMALSTVGGWVACRGAGQYSTRYGKIEDIVTALQVVLADGRVVRTGGWPRGAVGPDLTQMFVGSEGTLGVITEATMRAHPLPAAERQAAFGFASFADGLDACRRVLRRGGRPAVLRLYDTTEGARNFEVPDHHLLLVLDEGDPADVDATFAIVDDECRTATRLDDELVGRWLAHRNDVSALEKVVRLGVVVDTIEIAARWAALPRIYDDVLTAVSAIDHTLSVSAHQSHAYTDGACLYFTFAGRLPDEANTIEDKNRYYRDVWDAATHTVLAAGGALSHHHGVGLNRARFMPAALGPAFDVLVALKRSLDPNGILNPGKLGLPDPFGEIAWP
jgi:alkyldihydroxyacetonephosphate synthase